MVADAIIRRGLRALIGASPQSAKMRLRHCIGALLIGLVACLASAQQYPLRPVKIIVPNAPAGAADFSARLGAATPSAAFGQLFILDNRIGAEGTLGSSVVPRSSAGGYTVIVACVSLGPYPSLFRNL